MFICQMRTKKNMATTMKCVWVCSSEKDKYKQQQRFYIYIYYE
jgi:hypothetical protein